MGLLSVLWNCSPSLRILARLLTSLSRLKGLGSGGVGTKLRPLSNTDSSCLESVWDDRLTTCEKVPMNGVLLCRVLWLYLTNLRACLTIPGAVFVVWEAGDSSVVRVGAAVGVLLGWLGACVWVFVS